mgnify:CR=1 FL=1
MKTYMCVICGYVYDEAKGDPDLQQQARDAVVKLQGGDPEHRRLWERMTAAAKEHGMDSLPATE